MAPIVRDACPVRPAFVPRTTGRRQEAISAAEQQNAQVIPDWRITAGTASDLKGAFIPIGRPHQRVSLSRLVAERGVLGSVWPKNVDENRCLARWTVCFPIVAPEAGQVERNSKKDLVTGPIRGFCALQARGLAVAFRLRVDEGDREGRQAECHPHLMCPIPQHVLRRTPGCHIVRGIKCHLNEDGSRVRASENGKHTVLGKQISQLADPLIAQRRAIVPGQPELNQPRLDHPRNSSPAGESDPVLLPSSLIAARRS
jgi:hypothetical protein